MKTQHQMLLSMALVVLGTLTAIDVGANQQQLATSISETRREAGRTQAQLEATLVALNGLATQTKGNLRPTYDAFAAEIPKTEAAARSTLARVDWMENKGREYFSQWQKDLDGIGNESLRRKAQKRFDAVLKSYDKVSDALAKGAEKFEPFLSDLTDIQTTVANDITPGGVKAIRSTVKSANWNYRFVNRSIKDALKEMTKMEKALSPHAR